MLTELDQSKRQSILYDVNLNLEEWSFSLGISPAGSTQLNPAKLSKANKEHIL